MAGQVLTQTLGGAPVNPYDQQVADYIAQMGKNQRQPMYSPEEQQARTAQNEREYQMGLLMQLSGNQQLGGVGAQVFKQALAQRQPRVTERGVADPLTGKFTYDPDYLDQQEQAKLQALQRARSEAQVRIDTSTRDEAMRRDLAQQHNQTLAAMHADKQEPLVQVLDPNNPGQVTYMPRSQAAGMQAPPRSGSTTASEDERKAAGWYQQAQLAYKNMLDATTADPSASKPTPTEITLQTLSPKHGADAAYARMTPARQRFVTGASSFSEAVLRAATGAGVNKDEALQKVQELTPRFGEDPTVTEMKKQGAQMYLEALLTRAGRAAPKGATPMAPAGGGAPGGAPGAAPDPLGLRGGR